MENRTLLRLLYDAAHDNDRAAAFAVEKTVAAFGHQWAEIPSGEYMLSDPRFVAEVGDIISAQELCVDKQWFHGKRVLDAGCGGGRWSYGFATLGCEVTAVDTNLSAIAATSNALTRSRRPHRIVHSTLETVHEKLPHASFDLVWCWGVAHHCASFTGVLASLSKLVKPGGLIHMYLYGRESIPYEDDVTLFGERLRYNFAETEADRDAFLAEKMAGHGLDRHHVHDIYAPLINRRFMFDDVKTMLEATGCRNCERPIKHGEVWVTAVKDGATFAGQRLPEHSAPYWFQRHLEGAQ